MFFWFNALVSGVAFVAMPYWIAEQIARADDARNQMSTEELNVRRCGLCDSDQLHRRGMCLVCKTGAEPYVPAKPEKANR